ncbi:hypothetical protein ACLI1A_01720 [Flavobacterium sp. RHBU_3]|uniref:hypothetical protein n=1 Tax=Flavobacterium sp. RHBU_3 TaxID=3391184 RepID=UPI0039852A58
MKKNLLTTAFVLLLVAFVGSCSSDETLVQDTSNDSSLTARGSFWGGKLANVNSDGTTTFTVDPSSIKADLEELMASNNQATTLQTVFITKKVNVNDSNDFTYALIGSDNVGTSIGVMLSESGGGLYFQGSDGLGFQGSLSGTTCRGCSFGCFLEYVMIQGKKAFYCNSAGCGEFCEKKYTE